MTEQPSFQHAHDEQRLGVRVRGLLDRLLDAYGQLDALSQRQREHIEAEDSTNLLVVLQEREQLVETVLGLNAELEPLLHRVTVDSNGEVALRVENVRRLARQVAERDEADRQTMQSRRDSMADQLASIGRHRGAAQAYAGGPTQSGPRYQDREG